LVISSDTTPPVIQITYPNDNSFTNIPKITISGIVSDVGSGVKSIKINSNSVTFTDNIFNATIQLQEGKNTITIIAVDKAGNSSSKTLNVYYRPQIAIILQIGKTNFTVNGKTQYLDSPPIIKNSRTLVPIRAIVEALGGNVTWNAIEYKVTVTFGSNIIELWIGKNTAKVNGVSKPIDSDNSKVIPEIINSRTMLPLRFISESLGCDVQWDEATKTITITYSNNG
jgi:hypothetical protein